MVKEALGTVPLAVQDRFPADVVESRIRRLFTWQ